MKKLGTHCNKGHELTKENTYLYKYRSGKIQRSCKFCKNRGEKAKKYFREYYRKNNKKYRVQNQARSKLRNNIRAGKIIRMPCQVCGEPKSHGHHTDYTKALDVMWLCVKHHAELHKKSKRG